MRVGSLFSGIGGFDLGFERVGFEIAWQCEIDKYARAVLAHHWRGVPCYDDVRGLSGNAQTPLEPVDIIVFGSPCQDLSVAGKRAGLDGARSGLFFEATRIVREMRGATGGRFPTYVVWESVPGALSSSRGRDFAAVLDELAESGAVDIAWRIIDAQHWVPQRRRRLFTLAIYPPAAVGRTGIGRAAEILSLGEGVRRDPPSRRTPGEGVAGTLGGSSQQGGFRTADLDNSGAFIVQSRYARNGRGAPSEIAYPLTAEEGKGEAAMLLVTTEGAFEKNDNLGVQAAAIGIGGSNDGGVEFGGQAEGDSGFHLRLQNRDVGSMGVLAAEVQNAVIEREGRDERGPILALDVGSVVGDNGGVALFGDDGSGGPRELCHGVGDSSVDVTNTTTTLAWCQAIVFSPTQITSPAGDPSHPLAAGAHVPLLVGQAMSSKWAKGSSGPAGDEVQNLVAPAGAVRRLTPVECCRLQGFPDNWLEIDPPLADSHKYRALGNAVCVPVAEWIARRIMGVAQ